MLKYLKIINYFLKSFVRQDLDSVLKISLKHRVKDNLAETVEKREREKKNNSADSHLVKQRRFLLVFFSITGTCLTS